MAYSMELISTSQEIKFDPKGKHNEQNFLWNGDFDHNLITQGLNSSD